MSFVFFSTPDWSKSRDFEHHLVQLQWNALLTARLFNLVGFLDTCVVLRTLPTLPDTTVRFVIFFGFALCFLWSRHQELSKTPKILRIHYEIIFLVDFFAGKKWTCFVFFSKTGKKPKTLTLYKENLKYSKNTFFRRMTLGFSNGCRRSRFRISAPRGPPVGGMSNIDIPRKGSQESRVQSKKLPQALDSRLLALDS